MSKWVRFVFFFVFCRRTYVDRRALYALTWVYIRETQTFISRIRCRRESASFWAFNMTSLARLTHATCLHRHVAWMRSGHSLEIGVLLCIARTMERTGVWSMGQFLLEACNDTGLFFYIHIYIYIYFVKYIREWSSKRKLQPTGHRGLATLSRTQTSGNRICGGPGNPFRNWGRWYIHACTHLYMAPCICIQKTIYWIQHR